MSTMAGIDYGSLQRFLEPDYAKMARYRTNVDNINVVILLVAEEDEALFYRTRQLPVLITLIKDRHSG